MNEEEEQLVEAFRQMVVDELLPEIRAIRLEIERCRVELRDARVDSELRRMVGLQHVPDSAFQQRSKRVVTGHFVPGLQPSGSVTLRTQAFGLGWYVAAPLALNDA